MVKRGAKEYQLWIEPEVHAAHKELPGNIRQRIKRVVDDLRGNARPSASDVLDISNLDLPTSINIRRIRLDNWRILYAVNEDESWVWVLGIYRRPPYQYENPQELVTKLRS